MNIKTQDNPCGGCNGACCREISVEIGTPRTKKDWEEIKWMVCHKDVNVFQDHENDWLIEFRADCDYLDEKHKCTIYEKRPSVCSDHSNQDCIIHSDDYFKIRFTSLEDVENYLKKKNYKWMKNKN